MTCFKPLPDQKVKDRGLLRGGFEEVCRCVGVSAGEGVGEKLNGAYTHVRARESEPSPAPKGMPPGF